MPDMMGIGAALAGQAGPAQPQGPMQPQPQAPGQGQGQGMLQGPEAQQKLMQFMQKLLVIQEGSPAQAEAMMDQLTAEGVDPGAILFMLEQMAQLDPEEGRKNLSGVLQGLGGGGQNA